MSRAGLLPIRGPEDFASAFDVSRETIARLTTYESLLRQWQKAVNLVAPSTLDEIWHRHFADSAQLLPLAPTARTWADLGSGAGFPGLVVAILLADSRATAAPPPGGGRAVRPRLSPAPGASSADSIVRAKSLDASGGGDRQHTRQTPPPDAPNELPPQAPPRLLGRRKKAALTRGASSSPLEGEAKMSAMARDEPHPAAKLPRVTLIESNARKCAFLREVVRQTGIGACVSVDILSTRIETAATQASLRGSDVVSARALAPLDKLLGLAAALFTPVTVGLFLKGRDVAAELEAAKKAWNFNAELVPSRTDRDGHVVVVRNLEPKSEGMKS